MMREQTVIQTKIRHLKMNAPLCVDAGTKCEDVLNRMKEERRSCVLVCQGSKCIGIFTERDFLNRILGKKVDLQRPVDDFMSKEPRVLTLDDTVGQAIRIMQEHGYRNVALVDQQGNCSGLLQIRNVIDFLAELFPEEVLNASPRQQFQDTDGA